MKNALQFPTAALCAAGVLFAVAAAEPTRAEPTGSAVSVTSDLAEMGMDPLLRLTGNVKVFTDEIHLNGIMQAPDGTLIPGAATKWEVSPDLHSWIWTVREGVKFHDGSTMTAEDFAFSWKRAVLSEDSENAYKEAYGPLIEDIYAEGNTVIVKTKQPEPLMPLWWPTYDNQVGYVLSKAQWEREGNEGYRTHPIGAGQFKLKELNTASRYVDLEAWEEHYCCVPTVKNVRIMEVPELSTRLALLRTGEADIIEANPTVAKEIEDAGFQTKGGLAGALSVMWYTFQHFADNPFHDQRVREAVSIAIDRQAMLDRLYAGAGGPLSSFFSGPGTIGYVNDLQADPYDPERAKQLMEEAGYPDGFEVKILTYDFDGDFPDLPTMSQAILGFLQEINITGEVDIMEWPAMQTLMSTLHQDACGGEETLCDQETAAHPEVATEEPFIMMIRGDKSRYHSLRQNRGYQSTFAKTRPMIQVPEVDAALQLVTDEFDLAKQTEYFEDYNRVLREGFYNAPLLYVDTVFGVSNKVHSWEPIAGRPYPNNHGSIVVK
jgi:peptide/nickel transport system substrate-binding protein